MADIRIKDLATTATTTASDDFMAVDGAINGTRKLSAATPAFLTSVTTPTLTAPAATNLTLTSGLVGTNKVNFPDTLTASSSTAGAVTIGNGTAATNVAIGGGKVNIGDTTAGSAGAGALVVAGGISAGNTGAASYFGGAVTGLRFIASTSLIAGDFTSTNDVAIVAKSTTAVYNPEIAAFLAPSQLTYGAGAYSNVYCGVAQSAYNSGSLMFAYTGAGSTSNAFGLGMHGQLPTILINGSKQTTFAGLIFPQQAVTASAPSYVKGAIYFDTTLNKLRVGGATGWETITSV